MKIGDTVMRCPETICEREDGKGAKPKIAMAGTVVYIHPAGRYHTVEFAMRGGTVRESFAGIGELR